MSSLYSKRLRVAGCCLTAGVLGLVGVAQWVAANPPGKQQPPPTRRPVYRVAKTTGAAAPARRPAVQQHPLDAALNMARQGLVRMQRDIKDYTCKMIKRERVNGKLSGYQTMYCKFRNRRIQDGKIVVPFSVYFYFLSPADIKGREVIYVEGRNNGKLCAHEGGGKTWLPTVWLKPTGSLAMKGQLYPITDSGMEMMVRKLIERGTQEKKFPDVQVNMDRLVKVNGRVCKVLEVRHPTRRPEYEFQFAQIFIDRELNVPIRYAAYDWPTSDDPAPVQEEYTYVDVKLNVGLTDRDFDTKNPDYNF